MPRIRPSLVLAALLALAAAPAAFAQGVGINATGAAADTSAILDLTASNKGFLPPRMTSVQRGAIVLPATGLVVYQTDGVQGLYWNAGTPAAPSWKQVAEAGGSGGQWSTSGSDLYYDGGAVSVGTSTIDARLTVVDDLDGLRVQTNTAGGALASFGGFGTFNVDAPGVVGGRLALLENGLLGLGRTAPVARLDVLGGNWDVVNGEGDVRIGDGLTRLKIGIATGGGGTGSASIMEQGPAGGYNVLSLGTQGNKVLHVVGATQRIGIGTDAPTAPLGFPPSLGKKITLYPGPTGDVGIGVAGNRLQLYADHPGADVALGYDQGGTFNERFAFKNNGALAVNGNAGSAGQVLQSNGSAASPTWTSPTAVTYNSLYQATSTSSVTLTSASPSTTVPGMSLAVPITTQSKVLISMTIPVEALWCFACGGSSAYLDLYVDGVFLNRYALTLGNGQRQTFAATYLLQGLSAGTRTIHVDALAPIGNDTMYGGTGLLASTLTLQVVPQ